MKTIIGIGPASGRGGFVVYESTFNGRGDTWVREMFESPPCKPFADGPVRLNAVRGADGV